MLSKKVNLIFTLLIAHSSTFPTIRKVFQVTPDLRCAPIKLNEITGPGKSITHQHLQLITKSPTWELPNLMQHLKRCYDFHNQSEEALLEFSQLVLKGIELERQWSPSHHVFYHGTLGTKLILLETILAQAKQQKEFQDLFLLRKPGSTDHLEPFPSSYDYTVQRIKSTLIAKQGLGRFDNEEPIRSALLSANTAMLANLQECNNEDSISYMAGSSRFGPRDLNKNIANCLQSHGISNLPKDLKRFLDTDLGSLAMIFIPKPLAHLAYLSHPFGIPLGLPQSKLLSSRLPLAEVQELIDNHHPIYPDQDNSNHDKFPQARILLKPNYFANNNSPIQMKLFLWEQPFTASELTNNFKAIKELAPVDKTTN